MFELVQTICQDHFMKTSSATVITKTLLTLISLVVSVELHEIVHLLMARAMGLPSRFLNFTAVGLSKVEAMKYPAEHLAFMNGIAPLFSFLVLGCGSLIFCRSRIVRSEKVNYFVAWLAIFNLPYLGLQIMLMGGPSRSNGTGNDFATVFDFLGMSPVARAILGAFGLLIFIALQSPLKEVINMDASVKTEEKDFPLPRWRSSVGYFLLIFGFGAAVISCRNNILQNYSEGTLWVLCQLVVWGLASVCLTRWKTAEGKMMLCNWILPCLIATVLLVPLGFEGNDFLMLWIFVLPMMTGAAYFKTLKARHKIFMPKLQSVRLRNKMGDFHQ